MTFPRLPRNIKNAAGIRDALIQAKPRVSTGEHDAKARFICGALHRTEHPDRLNAIKFIEGCLNGYVSLTAWATANKQLSWPLKSEEQAFRHLWLDYLIEELAKC